MNKRLLVVASRVAEGHILSESGVKHLQHIFTSWFPRAVYSDLDDDTTKVNVVVQRSGIGGKNQFSTTFLKAGNMVTKKIDYEEDRMVGKVCPQYDQSKTKYHGQFEGFDCRLVYYTVAI